MIDHRAADAHGGVGAEGVAAILIAVGGLDQRDHADLDEVLDSIAVETRPWTCQAILRTSGMCVRTSASGLCAPGLARRSWTRAQ
jgi:hypothetical protein